MFKLIEIKNNNILMSSKLLLDLEQEKINVEYNLGTKTIIKEFNYIVSEYDIWMMKDSKVNLGIFTDFDIAMEAIKKEYGDFEESDEHIQEYMQMTPLNNPNGVKIDVEIVELNVLEEI